MARAPSDKLNYQFRNPSTIQAKGPIPANQQGGAAGRSPRASSRTWPKPSPRIRRNRCSLRAGGGRTRAPSRWTRLPGLSWRSPPIEQAKAMGVAKRVLNEAAERHKSNSSSARCCTSAACPRRRCARGAGCSCSLLRAGRGNSTPDTFGRRPAPPEALLGEAEELAAVAPRRWRRRTRGGSSARAGTPPGAGAKSQSAIPRALPRGFHRKLEREHGRRAG